MVHIDMTAPDRDLTPGVDLWEIRECVKKPNRKGDNMLSFKYARVSNPSDHMYDNIMLEGGGWEIGKGKLGALLPPDFVGELDPISLVGRRLWVSTVVREYEGRSNLAVNIDELKHRGLQREDDVPPGCSLPEPKDEVPF